MTANCKLCGQAHELPREGLDPLDQLVPCMEKMLRSNQSGQENFVLASAVLHLIEQNRMLREKVRTLELGVKGLEERLRPVEHHATYGESPIAGA